MENLQSEMRKQARERVARMPASERETLLIKNWMSHDARWFMAVAKASGMEMANRLNQEAAREIGKVEAVRMARDFGLERVRSVPEYLLAQEVFIQAVGPELLDYEVYQTGERSYRAEIMRCFAAENIQKAGMGDQYNCGVFARVQGWLDGLKILHEMTPGLGKCFHCQGEDCAYQFQFGR